jgi:hypothetical protein
MGELTALTFVNDRAVLVRPFVPRPVVRAVQTATYVDAFSWTRREFRPYPRDSTAKVPQSRHKLDRSRMRRVN